MSYLELFDLKKSYGAHRIIGGVSFSIEKGTLVALLGPSGSGKTTVLRCIAGLEPVDTDSGKMVLEGETLAGGGEASVPPEKRRMGMVFQNYAVWPHLDVFENVAFPLRIAKAPDKDLKKRVEGTLDLVRLQSFAKRYPHELSGGQQQRVAIARALVATPRILLLDEPLSNLDALLREELGAEIRKLQQQLGLTTILVTHDQREALALADKLIVLDKGSIVAEGAPETLYVEPPNDFAAEFLAGGQRCAFPGEASPRVVLPRRWRVEGAAEDRGAIDVVLIARIFRGTEYEYLGKFAASSADDEAIRFFDAKRREAGERVRLWYTGV